MGKGKTETEKVQVILICAALVMIEISIYLWLPYWQTILLTLAFNLLGVAFILEFLEKEKKT